MSKVYVQINNKMRMKARIQRYLGTSLAVGDTFVPLTLGLSPVLVPLPDLCLCP